MAKHEIRNHFIAASWIWIGWFCLLIILPVSCKEELDDVPPKNPLIRGIDPIKGTAGTNLTVTGENFENERVANEVTINGKRVEVISASASQLVVLIPEALGTGEITITTSAGKARGPEFIYFDEVMITSIDPAVGPFNTEVTINGKNFETDMSLNKVKVNGVEVLVLSANADELVVSIGKGVGTGKVTVETEHSIAEGQVFKYKLVPVVTTIAGSASGFLDAQGELAQFNNPDGLAVDADGNTYVCDKGNNRIRLIDADGNVSTFAGTGVQGIGDGNLQTSTFNLPSGIVMTADGTYFVTDSGSGNIRKITNTGNVVTIAGDGIPGFTDGIGSTARFGSPRGITLDNNDNLWIADFGNSVIRKISPLGVVTTIAGSGTPGFANGIGIFSQFNFPSGLIFDNVGNLIVADNLNNRIRSMSFSSEVTSYAGASGGYQDGSLAESKFLSPVAIAFDLEGDLIIADAMNYRIRRISKLGEVTTVAGDGTSGLKDGVGLGAQFGLINGIAVNSKGDIIISDGGNHVIRKIVYE